MFVETNIENIETNVENIDPSSYVCCQKILKTIFNFSTKHKASKPVELPIPISFDKVIQDLLNDAKDPGSDPVAVKAMKTFDLMDKVEVFLI